MKMETLKEYNCSISTMFKSNNREHNMLKTEKNVLNI